MKQQRYICDDCGHQHKKWSGQCTDCGAWNTLTLSNQPFAKATGVNTAALAQTVTAVKDIQQDKFVRLNTGSKEFDRVLGGGLVPGSVVLVGGDPGIGKSTLLSQLTVHLNDQSVLYVSGEESMGQIADRMRRLSQNADNVPLLCETHCESIVATIIEQKPAIVIIDSIQTLTSDASQSTPGSVTQLRASAQSLIKLAKTHNITIVLVGHVNKDGQLAGPKVLEHMVDTVLYIEGQRDGTHRLMRSVKNRFGAVNEIGILSMGETGMKDVDNPSAVFLSHRPVGVPGSVIAATWEGTRPLLVEIQALVDPHQGKDARRLSVGLEHQRVLMMLAILSRHGRMNFHGQDVFVNIVGGLRLQETAIDLPLMAALISSHTNQAIPDDWAFFGEIGLSGEIRPVQHSVDRVKTAVQHGFKTLVIPSSNQSKSLPKGVKYLTVNHVAELFAIMQKTKQPQKAPA